MTGRDRIVIVGLAALGRARRGVAAGRRPRARKGRQARRRSERRAGPAHDRRKPGLKRRSRAGAVPERVRVAREPRQSRPGRSGSALADLPARAGDRPEERRIHLDHLGRRQRCRREQSRFESERCHWRRAPPPWRRARASRRCRSRSCSAAASKSLSSLFHQLDGFALRTTSGGLQVSGRLLTVQSVKLAHLAGPARAPARSSGRLSAAITATAYVLPAGQSLTGGATSAGPAGTATQTASTGASSFANSSGRGRR